MAARLCNRGHTKRIVYTGSRVTGTSGQQPQDLDAETATISSELDVPAATIVQLAGPRNTSEEIAGLAQLVRERGRERVGLVNSAWHMRRALRVAHRADLATAPLDADFRGGTLAINIHTLMPSGMGMVNTRLVA